MTCPTKAASCIKLNLRHDFSCPCTADTTTLEFECETSMTPSQPLFTATNLISPNMTCVYS
eukprot:12929153-Prorocentrum_lima.AAC.1